MIFMILQTRPWELVLRRDGGVRQQEHDGTSFDQAVFLQARSRVPVQRRVLLLQQVPV